MPGARSNFAPKAHLFTLHLHLHLLGAIAPLGAEASYGVAKFLEKNRVLP